MVSFALSFDLSDYKRLDQFALLACQNYNLSNNNDWFGAFRGGLYGFYARIHGIVTHYLTVHAWLPAPRDPVETEYHLSSIFFNMDSAIECITFALNALGYAVAPQAFRDISDDSALKHIFPKNILDESLEGYKLFFPTLQSHWQANRKLLSVIVEQHDVSKHRETIFEGGMARLDPPPGFYEALGIGDDQTARSMFWPMAEIILRKNPKSVRSSRKGQEANDSVLLETVASDFCLFINKNGACALEDAKMHIKLPHSEFIQEQK